MTILLALTLLTAVDFVRIAPDVQEMTDPYTGLKVRVRVDGFEIARTETAGPDGRMPLANVSWLDAVRFANDFSRQRGLPECYDLNQGGTRLGPDCKGYRLPTEAEWSVAFRLYRDPTGVRSNLGLNQVTGVDPQALLKLSVRPVAVGDSAVVEDLSGNVWEWCEDWFSANPTPWPLHNPRGPLRGMAKVIRGGSYQTTRTSWQGTLRSSVDPGVRSPRTGFRLVRSTGETAEVPAPDWGVFRQAPASGAAVLDPLTSVSRSKWTEVIGMEKVNMPASEPPAVRMLRRIEEPWFDGRLMEYETEPGIWEKMLILDGDPGRRGPRPVVIVPFYDVDTPAGVDLGGRNFAMTSPVIWFARQAAQRGYLAVAVRWYGESYGERYDEAVATLAARHPGATGMGKWVSDARRLVDYLVTLPEVDAGRIAMMGHSLGGKMSLYAAAMDERIQATVVSDPGIPMASTNYSDYWYLGDKLKALPAGSDHHELVGLMAPRGFLVIAGETDDTKTWGYLEAARGLWGTAGERRLGWIHHAKGHRPTPESMSLAWTWLEAVLRR